MIRSLGVALLFWFGTGMMARADEVIAVAPRTPGIVAGSTPIAEAGGKRVRVALGRPSTVRGVASDLPSPSVLESSAYRPSAAATPYAPAVSTAFSTTRSATVSDFAIERVAFFEPVPGQTPTPIYDSGPPASVMPSPAQLQEPTVGMEPMLAEDEGIVNSSRAYFGAEYLLWTIKNARVPVLATTSVNPLGAGFLGDPDTRILFAGPLDHNLQHGARFRAGYWLDTCKPIAIEGSFFFLSPRSDRFLASSDGSTVIARPFFNLNDGIEFSEIVASPVVSAGTLAIDAPSRLLGYDLNLRCNLCCASDCDRGYRVDLIGGYRYLSLSEGLFITEIGVGIPPLVPAQVVTTRQPGELFRIDDRFDTQNRFYGGQIGLDSEFRRGRFSLGVRSTLAMGVTRQVLNINGTANFVSAAGVPSQQLGGLLALDSNIGRFSQSRFAVVPEVGLTLGYQVTDTLRVTAGYNFLYWSSVLRPGDQIDRQLDVTRIPDFLPRDANGNFIEPGTGRIIPPTGLRKPAPLLKEKDFWATGASFGMELRY